MKKKKIKVGIIKGSDIIDKTKPIQDIPFRTGRHITEKDRPRKKNWREWDERDI